MKNGWVNLPGSQLWARDDVERPMSIDAALAHDGIEVHKPYRKPGKRPGRNDPCPCGSGVKHKKCCLRFILEARKNPKPD